ncbi:MAG: hypothetical protein LBQ13_00445 [Endomicrobium sp.]|nr:hypothetical protein [Endomicrobium sp.]
MEGIPTLKDLVERNECAITFDLTEAYNHVPVLHFMKNLLEMCWKEEAFCFVPQSHQSLIHHSTKSFTSNQRAQQQYKT